MNIVDFIPKQSYFIPEADRKDRLLRCMDDRYGPQHLPLAHYGVPGAGLGIIADVVSGFEAALKQNNDDKLSLTQTELIRISATAVLAPTFHSADTHDESPVGGCGYLADTLEGKAGISAESAAHLKFVADKAIADGYEVVCFPDKHSASFVLFIIGDEIGVVPTAEDGTRAYVVHKDIRTELLDRVVQKSYKVLSALEPFPAVEEVVRNEVHAYAEKRFGEVAQNLGADKIPHYTLKCKDGKISYTEDLVAV